MTWFDDYKYEIEERTAILQEAGGSKAVAENQAAIAVFQRLGRTAEQEQPGEPQQQDTVTPRKADCCEDRLSKLKSERDAIGKKMRAEDDPVRKDRLFRQWMELTRSIIDARKE